MVDFLINTPNHKRWVLADGIHEIDVMIMGDYVYHAIWKPNRLGGLPERVEPAIPAIKLDPEEKWKEQSELIVELANKKYGPRTKIEQYGHGSHRKVRF